MVLASQIVNVKAWSAMHEWTTFWLHVSRRNLCHGYTQVLWANRDSVFCSLEEQRSLSVLDDAPRVVQRPESRIVCGGLLLMGKLYIRGRESHCVPDLHCTQLCKRTLSTMNLTLNNS